MTVFIAYISWALQDNRVGAIFNFMVFIFIFLSCLILTFILSGLAEMQSYQQESHNARSQHSSNIQESEINLDYQEFKGQSTSNFYLQISEANFEGGDDRPVSKPDFDSLD